MNEPVKLILHKFEKKKKQINCNRKNVLLETHCERGGHNK